MGTRVCARICVCMRVYKHLCVFIRMFVHDHQFGVFFCTFMCACVCAYVRIFKCVCFRLCAFGGVCGGGSGGGGLNGGVLDARLRLSKSSQLSLSSLFLSILKRSFFLFNFWLKFAIDSHLQYDVNHVKSSFEIQEMFHFCWCFFTTNE